MDNKEATRTCSQCHKEVAEANFDLHETHCSRFLCVCADCDEAVPKDQLEQHKEEQHTQVRCSKCNKKMERRHLMDHESDECVERLQTCQFCDLSLPYKDLDEHCLACGSRTELCRDCCRYVKLRDQAEHGFTCPGTGDDESPPHTTTSAQTKTTVRCIRCMGSFPADDIDQHELQCAAPTRWLCEDEEEEEEEEEEKEEKEEEEEDEEEDFSKQGATPHPSSTYKAFSLSDRVTNGPWGNEGNPDMISTCPHCHLALPLVTLRWHEVKCRIYILLK